MNKDRTLDFKIKLRSLRDEALDFGKLFEQDFGGLVFKRKAPTGDPSGILSQLFQYKAKY